jgi:uncharacterized membrane protein YgdD (TMEM256/DUF423 family)
MAIGSFVLAAAVAAGAFGAHLLAERLDRRALELWETATRYLIYSGIGVLLAGIWRQQFSRDGFGAAATLLFLGGVIFASTVGAIALGAPKWLGAITPIGGVLLIGGFLALGWTALRL